MISFTKEHRRVTTWYFYLRDEGFGPAFIKICAYFPYPVKVWVNGHEWAKRQAIRAGITFTELSDGFAATSDPDGLQAICDRRASAGSKAHIGAVCKDRRLSLRWLEPNTCH